MIHNFEDFNLLAYDFFALIMCLLVLSRVNYIDIDNSLNVSSSRLVLCVLDLGVFLIVWKANKVYPAICFSVVVARFNKRFLV